MSPDVKRRVFEPFFTTKAAGKGTGLGLSTAYGIIKQIGGSIEVASKLGRGTRIRVYLPRFEAEGAAEIEPNPEECSNRSGTILLVEDKDIVRDVVREMLERLGYDVVEAPSAEEALKVFAGLDQVALVLTDIILTGMNGTTLVEQLRQFAPALKALYMTGYTDDVIIERGFLQGEAHILEKPFSLQALADAVSESLD